jgi:quinohemoprotein ethanol dehydrogenase
MMMRVSAAILAAGLMVLAGCQPAAPKGADQVDAARIAAGEAGNWLTHGRTYEEQRHSPLTKISTATVKDLGLAWTAELRTNRGQSATPIVVDGVMYTTSAWSVVYAFDAKTGKELWVWDPQVDKAVGANACCDVTNRGVAVYQGQVFVGVIDGRLVALNAKTGAKAWETVSVDQKQPYTITGAPRAANGLVYIGNGGAEYGVRGYVSAYDAKTGALVWRFYTTPNPAGPDNAASDSVRDRQLATWDAAGGAWRQSGGGGTVWDAIVFDPEFGQVIIGVGNGSPWNRVMRSPKGGSANNDNWFISSIVALDAKTGAYKWHYQTTPGDTWDFTATQPIMLATLKIDGKDRKVAMQAPKNGFFYVLDRADGKLISAKPIVPMEPEAATRAKSPMLPISWSTGEIGADGRPVENPSARYEKGLALVHPSSYGAHNWHPMAFNPQTGLVYIPIQDILQDWTSAPQTPYRQGRWNTGTTHLPLPPAGPGRDGLKNLLTGALIAWDPVAQKEVWRAKLNGPWNGGALSTAGGLVFQGGVDGKFRAFDAKTGAQLWEFDNQAATLSGPITYEVDGEQYVAVNAGYGSVFFLVAGFAAPREGNNLNGRIYVFKLGGKTEAPKIAFEPLKTPAPPVIRASARDLAQGEFLYGQFCAVCHGASVVGGGVIPDLRKSAQIQDRGRFAAIALEGELTSRGMPAFKQWMSPAQLEQVRAYIAREAGVQHRIEAAATVAPGAPKGPTR